MIWTVNDPFDPSAPIKVFRLRMHGIVISVCGICVPPIVFIRIGERGGVFWRRIGDKVPRSVDEPALAGVRNSGRVRPHSLLLRQIINPIFQTLLLRCVLFFIDLRLRSPRGDVSIRVRNRPSNDRLRSDIGQKFRRIIHVV